VLGIRSISSANTKLFANSSKKLLCSRCRRRGKLYYDFRNKKFIHEGGCYEYFICAFVVKMRFLAWLNENNELLRKNAAEE